MPTTDPYVASQLHHVAGTIDAIVAGYTHAWWRYDALLRDLREQTRYAAVVAAFGPCRTPGTGGGHPTGHADPTPAALLRLGADPALDAHRAAWDRERRALERRCDRIASHLASLDSARTDPNLAREIQRGIRTPDGRLRILTGTV